MSDYPKEYLGDSVYVEYDGEYLWLTTNNGFPDDPRNKIALEPSVYSALFGFVERLKPAPSSKAMVRIELEKKKHRDEIAVLEIAASILDRTPDHLLSKASVYEGRVDFNHLSREDAIAIIASLAAGKWEKSTNECYEDKIDYIGVVDGITVRLWAAAPPDSCRVIEVEEIIPEQRVMKRKLVCSEAAHE